MRSAIGMAWMFLATACAAPSRIEAHSESADAAGARAQLEYLRSLEGIWWGTGGQGTDLNRVEIRYRSIEGGEVVEETCFPDTLEELVTKYFVDGGRLVS